MAPPLHRRDLLRLLAAGAGASMLPVQFGLLQMGCGGGGGDASDPLALADTGPVLPAGMPLSVLDPSRQEVDLQLEVISGRLPTDLQGHVFVIAAMPLGTGGMIFNGDGMVYRVDFGAAARPALKSRLIKSPCYHADRATRGDEALGFRNFGVARMSGKLGMRNELNTAFLPMMDGRLMVTYDAGRPWEIDPASLELVTPMGWRREWRNGLPVAPTTPFQGFIGTAHPYYDEHTGEVISINYGSEGLGPESVPFVDLIRWDGEGSLERGTLVDEASGQPVSIKQSAHQLAVTRDHVIVVDCAFLVENEQIFDSSLSRAQAPDTVAWIVRRDALTSDGSQVPARRAIIPRESIHLVADYDDSGGRITLYIAHNNATDASEWIRADDVRYGDGQPVAQELVGLIPTCTDRNVIGRYEIDAASGELRTQQIVSDETTWGLAFLTHQVAGAPGRHDHLFFNSVGFNEETLTARVAELYADHPYRAVPLAELAGPRPGCLIHYDAGAQRIADAYTFPPGRIGNSPQFVPRPNARDGADGYLVCTVVSDDRSRPNSSGDELWIFDARALSQGPLTRLGPRELSLGFTIHTTSLPALTPRRSDYLVPVRQDFASSLVDQEQAIVSLFEDEIFPHFDR